MLHMIKSHQQKKAISSFIFEQIEKAQVEYSATDINSVIFRLILIDENLSCFKNNGFEINKKELINTIEDILKNNNPAKINSISDIQFSMEAHLLYYRPSKHNFLEFVNKCYFIESAAPIVRPKVIEIINNFDIELFYKIYDYLCKPKEDITEEYLIKAKNKSIENHFLLTMSELEMIFKQRNINLNIDMESYYNF